VDQTRRASHCLCMLCYVMLCFPLTPKRRIIQLITAGSPISLVSKASLAMKMCMNTALSQLTVNDKGGSDCRVLNQCLTGYHQERLYPDAADVPGKRCLLYKMDGRPGRLDEERSLLLKIINLVVFISSLVFQTPRLKSIKRQADGPELCMVSSSSRVSVGTLQHGLRTNLVRDFFSRQQLFLVTMNTQQQIVRRPTHQDCLHWTWHDQYGLILSGGDRCEQGATTFSTALRPAFHNAFCKSKNLSVCLAAWAKVVSWHQVLSLVQDRPGHDAQT
jgi:hypothetical protein